VGLTTPHSKKLIVTKVEQRKIWMDLMMMERVGDRWGKMEGSCTTGQSPQWAVVPVEEEETVVKKMSLICHISKVSAVAQWLRYCATNRKVAGSIPDGVIGIFPLT
jgi:hypothetical protein